ncbi:MAG: hypothetical protein O3A25_00540 [Acidobacteria bacterium]|nr:hypothetical protein [Acidobacteriota bacterium]
MAGINRGWAVRLGLVACIVALAVFNWTIRREPRERSDALTTATAAGTAEPMFVNEAWHIRNMATAHGAFVIEVEADDPSQAATIARALVEPIKDDYDEILVYVNQRGGDSDLPERRLQWTPRDGYVEIAYDQTSP